MNLEKQKLKLAYAGINLKASGEARYTGGLIAFSNVSKIKKANKTLVQKAYEIHHAICWS